MQQSIAERLVINGIPQDPLSLPTVQAAILQAERMARLEEEHLTLIRDLVQLREETSRQLTKILEQTTKTNGSVGKVIRDQENDRRDITTLQEKVGQAQSLAVDAGAAVDELGAEVDAITKARGNQERDAKTRWDFVKAQVKVASIGIGIAAGLGGRELLAEIVKAFG